MKIRILNFLRKINLYKNPKSCIFGKMKISKLPNSKNNVYLGFESGTIKNKSDRVFIGRNA